MAPRPKDILNERALSPETAWLVKRRIARGLMIVAVVPMVALLLGFVLSAINPCAFGDGPGYCGDMNHPEVMIPTVLLMFGMSSAVSLPVFIAARVWSRRLEQRGPERD